LSLRAGGEPQIVVAIPVVANEGTVSQVSFISGDTQIAQASPEVKTEWPWTTQVSGQRSGTTTLSAQVSLSPSGSCTSSLATINVAVGGWFQTQGGDVYAGGDLQDNIPNQAENPNLSKELDGWWGIITHQDENGVDLWEGYSSNNADNHWLAKSSYEGKSYGSSQFFKKKFALDLTSETFVQGREDLPGEDGVYYAQSSRTLSGSSWNLADDRWVVLIVEGDVNVETNITVPEGSFLAIVATGNINFDSDLVSNVQGMFVADGVIDTGDSANEFVGQGVFVGNNLSLGRDFNDDRNLTTPVETFVARPDFIMSSYKDATYNVWWFFQKWQEIAP
jgi:hypothetical protein